MSCVLQRGHIVEMDVRQIFIYLDVRYYVKYVGAVEETMCAVCVGVTEGA